MTARPPSAVMTALDLGARCASSRPRSPPKPTPSRRSRPPGLLQGERLSPARRASRRHAAHVHGAAVRRPAPRRAGRVHADRGQLLCRQPGRHDQPRATTRPCATRSWPSCKAALPLDGVLLGLHGAMVAHGYDDVRGRHPRARARDRRARMRDRRRARPALPPDAASACALPTSSSCYKEFPHTDVVERAEEVLDLVLRDVRGEIKPVMSLYDCRQIGSYPTTLPLMRGFVDRIKAMEGKDGVLSISIGALLPLCRRAGAGGPHPGGHRWRQGARPTGWPPSSAQEFVSMRGKTVPDYLDADGGDHGGARASTARPVVMADPADNAGGGAPTDNTTILRQLIAPRRGRRGDRADLGPGGGAALLRRRARREFPLRFGGKTGPASGQPIDADRRGHRPRRAIAGRASARPRCRSAIAPAIRVGGVDVVLITKRTQALGLELFRNVGVEPADEEDGGGQIDQPLPSRRSARSRRRSSTSTPTARCRATTASCPTPGCERPIWPLDAEAAPGLILYRNAGAGLLSRLSGRHSRAKGRHGRPEAAQRVLALP